MIIAAVFLLAVGLAPMYVFESGGFQPVDVPLSVLVVLVAVTARRDEVRPLAVPLVAALCFAFWVALVNGFHWSFSGDVFYARATIQVIYNLTIFVACTIAVVRLIESGRASHLLAGLLLACLVVALFRAPNAKVEGGSILVRGALSFNNPNQAGYFALLLIGTLLACEDEAQRWTSPARWRRLARVAQPLIIVFAHVLTVVSASRAALFGLILMDLLLVLRPSGSGQALLKRVVTLSVAAIAIAVAVTRSSIDLSSTAVWRRFTTRDLAEVMRRRTQDRLTENMDSAWDLVLGAGKTLTSDVQAEVHNSALDLWISYGGLGLVLFVIFLVLLCRPRLKNLRPESIYQLALLMPLVVYQMSHNGLRFRFFWMFLGVWTAVALLDSRRLSGARSVTASRTGSLDPPPYAAPSASPAR